MLSLLAIKQALRNGPYAWPGGYPLYFVTKDGEALSFAAVRANWEDVVLAHLEEKYHGGFKPTTGWELVAVETNWEDADLCCAETGERIESAYAED